MSEITTMATNTITRDQIDLWKRTFCKGANDDEMALFISVCKRTGLSPETRQMYLVGRWDKKAGREIMTPQTSIDGFRVIAERSGHYAGQIGPFYTDDGVWTDYWFKKSSPKAAKVGVLRHDFKEPLWGVAHWESYAQKDKSNNVTFMWSKMGEVMLAKCAEALALRKAFPNEMSGLYTEDEMAQATKPEPEKVANESAVVLDPIVKYDMNDTESRRWLVRNSKIIKKDITNELIAEINKKLDGVNMDDAPDMLTNLLTLDNIF